MPDHAEALNKTDRAWNERCERIDTKFTQMTEAQDERIEILVSISTRILG